MPLVVSVMCSLIEIRYFQAFVLNFQMLSILSEHP